MKGNRINRDTVVELWAKGMSSIEIAREMGVSEKGMHYIFRELGIEEMQPRVDKGMAAALWNSGRWSVEDIADELNAEVRDVIVSLKMMGCNITGKPQGVKRKTLEWGGFE